MSEKHRDAAASESEPTTPQVVAVVSIIALFVWAALSLVGIVSL
jgi:hypothetical protein